MRNSIVSLIPAAAAVLLTLASCSVAGNIADLRCDYLAESSAVDTQTPVFTWTYRNAPDFRQAGFSLAVASDAESLSEPDIWYSGAVKSSVSHAAMEDTGRLKRHTRYAWRITAWNADSSEVIISEPASFTTAMMRQEDWKGCWITDAMDKDHEAAPMFRKAFHVGKRVVSATIFMSAAGYGKIAVNGRPVSDSFLDPGYTHYDKRNLYSVTDVTHLIKQGENVVSAVLGNGFYNAIKPVATWNFENARWRDRARFILNLRIVYSDGSSETVYTDGSWRTSCEGPFVSNNIYSGDTYDATKEIPGWDKAGFDDSAWAAATPAPAPSPLLKAQKMPPIRTVAIIKPVSVVSFGDTVHVYDFGKNITGLCNLSISGERGTEVIIRHGELARADGSLEQGNIDIYYKPVPGHETIQTDKYILSGNGLEKWTPSFSYHGFRYAEVRTSVPMKLGKNNLSANYFHTDLQSSGTFECSDSRLNALWEMARRTYLNNLHSIPTDCPTREKNGWTADAYLAQEIGLMNFDGITFYQKWLDDFIDNQREDGRISGIIPTGDWGYDDWIGPVWDAAAFIIPYNLYLYYGDDSAIRKMWPLCKRYLEYLTGREQDGLVIYGIGDWVPYRSKTPTDFSTSCFYFYEYRLMAKFAEILGEDAGEYAAKAGRIREAINRKYYNPATGIYSTGTQAAQALALYSGVCPEQEKSKVAAALEDMVRANGGFLDFGTIGSKTVLRMLSKYGYAQTAFDMATKTGEPSWLAWIEKGLTSFPETWVLDTENFRDASADHIFLGDMTAWLMSDIAGIRADENAPGFSHIRIEPNFVKGLDWAKASYASVKGLVCSEWRREGNSVVLKVTIPDNTSATVSVNGKSRTLRSGRHKMEFAD